MMLLHQRFKQTNPVVFGLFVSSFFLCVQGLQAQCVYTSVTNGNWTNPATWAVTGVGCSTTPSTNSTVIINTTVTLNTNVSFVSSGGRDGVLTINAAGRLNEDATPRSISFGTGSGSFVNRFTNNGSLQVSNMTFSKSGGFFNAPATIKCNFSLQLQAAITISNTKLSINGNYNLDNGNVSSGGGGQMVILGCVTGPNGALNSSIVPPLTVCVKNTASTACGTGTCNGDVPIGNSTNCSIALPVIFEWVRTLYEPEQKRVRVFWKSAQEENNSYYQIERSAHGTAFDSIGVVTGAGTSTIARSYEFYDMNPFPELTYYRLKQVDENGESSLSKTMDVHTEKRTAGLLVHISGPSQLDLSFDPKGRPYQLHIYGLLGQLVFSESVNKPYTETSILKKIRFPFNQTIYTVCLTTAYGVTIKKVPVLNMQ
jgi:hypothetical protein